MVPQKPGDYIPAPPAACSQGRGGRPGFRWGQVLSLEEVGLWPSPVPSQKVSQFLITPPLINTVTPWAGAKRKHKEKKPLEVSSVSDPHSAPAGRNCPIPPHSHHSVPAAGQDWGLFPAELFPGSAQHQVRWEMQYFHLLSFKSPPSRACGCTKTQGLERVLM